MRPVVVQLQGMATPSRCVVIPLLADHDRVSPGLLEQALAQGGQILGTAQLSIDNEAAARTAHRGLTIEPCLGKDDLSLITNLGVATVVVITR